MRSTPAKCLHYYFNFMDAEVGLCYLRVPTWCPFRLQCYCNGHSWLARKLMAAGIDFATADNAFIRIDDFARAQQLAEPLKKSIYSLIDLRKILLGCNRRYLEFLSSLDDHSDGQRALQKLTEPKTDQKTTWRGFNFFATTDQAVLRAVLNPKFNIHGLRRADLKP